MKKVYCKPVMESEEFNVRQHVATSCNHHCKTPQKPNKPHGHKCPTHPYTKSDEKTCEEHAEARIPGFIGICITPDRHYGWHEKKWGQCKWHS